MLTGGGPPAVMLSNAFIWAKIWPFMSDAPRAYT